MASKISSLNEALTFILQGLYSMELNLKEEFPACCHKLTSGKIKREIERYSESSDNKMLKLERVFSYLMKEPSKREQPVIKESLNEVSQILSPGSNQVSDLLVIGCIQKINNYKITSYKSAYMFAAEMELDTASDLIQQILEWEMETNKALSALVIEEFNKMQLRKQN